MATMFIIEKAITIIVAILDLVNAYCEDPIHQMTCAGLFLMCIRVIIVTAGPMCRKNINKRHMLLYKQNRIDALKNELHRIANGKKEESEEFQERLDDVLQTKMYERQHNYNPLELEDGTGETNLPLLAVSQF